MPQPLRSGRNWRRCGADEFDVPPRAAWPSILPTLRAVQRMRQAHLLDGARVASAYRDEAFNRCEGGSAQSRHRLNNALDFDLRDDPGNLASLCGYWRAHGASLGLGLGFYDERHIHVDTSGFRTWGSDYTHRTSLCGSAPGTRASN